MLFLGCGVVDYRGHPHVAYCLRGGTVHLISTTESDLEESTMDCIDVYCYAHDVDSDIRVPYVQAFAAGNVWIKGGSSGGSKRLIPCVVYAWAGGIMDVYACGLDIPLGPEALSGDEMSETIALKELIENGSVELLFDLLSKDSPDDHLAR